MTDEPGGHRRLGLRRRGEGLPRRARGLRRLHASRSTIGRASEPRLVTVKVPDKDAETLIKAVSLSRNTFGFDSLAEAKQWLDTERPFLRAEFLFQPRRGQHRVDVRRQAAASR